MLTETKFFLISQDVDIQTYFANVKKLRKKNVIFCIQDPGMRNVARGRGIKSLLFT